jgi:anti-sigma28 factor (negative regulator of flagellin synthesis)
MSTDSEDNKNVNAIPRKRSLTSLSLQWLAERMRKTERIKAEIAAGKYSVSSADVAESLVSEPSDPHEINTSDHK